MMKTARRSCLCGLFGLLAACSVDPVPATSTAASNLVAINVAESWVNGWYAPDTGQRGSNSYVHSDEVYWSDANPVEPGKFTSQSDCSGFIDATMKKAYGYNSTSLNSWLCTAAEDCPGGRPLAVAYYNAILGESHFTIVPKAAQLAVGDMIAIKYVNDPNHDTGHVLWVDSQVQSDGTGSDSNGVPINFWKVDVIDSSSSYHGTADNRHTIGNGQGVGRGTMHLISYADGDLTGYQWSTWSGSTKYINGDGQNHTIVGGRYDNSTPGSTPATGACAVITAAQFDSMFPPTGRAAGYTYDSFCAAAASFPTFGTVGDTATRQREVAAFLGNVAHETSKLTSMLEGSTDPYCDKSRSYGCPASSYQGRGPLQLSWNYNYHDAGAALGVDLLDNPDLVLSDVSLGWKTSLWFWMTSDGDSYGYGPMTCHDAMTSGTTPEGFYKTIRIINGGYECNVAAGTEGANEQARRVQYYKEMLGYMGGTTGSMDTTLCPTT